MSRTRAMPTSWAASPGTAVPGFVSVKCVGGARRRSGRVLGNVVGLPMTIAGCVEGCDEGSGAAGAAGAAGVSVVAAGDGSSSAARAWRSPIVSAAQTISAHAKISAPPPMENGRGPFLKVRL
jgi:hypothetical protein